MPFPHNSKLVFIFPYHILAGIFFVFFPLACIFFYTPAITIKAQPLRIVPSICETVSHL